MTFYYKVTLDVDPTCSIKSFVDGPCSLAQIQKWIAAALNWPHSRLLLLLLLCCESVLLCAAAAGLIVYLPVYTADTWVVCLFFLSLIRNDSLRSVGRHKGLRLSFITTTVPLSRHISSSLQLNPASVWKIETPLWEAEDTLSGWFAHLLQLISWLFRSCKTFSQSLPGFPGLWDHERDWKLHGGDAVRVHT